MRCTHLWCFLERWLTDTNNPGDTEYVFYCEKCLKIKGINIGVKMVKK